MVPWFVLSAAFFVRLLLFSLLLLLTDSQDRAVRQFSPAGVFNYTSLLLSQSDDTLYVGARDMLFALNVNDITSHTGQKKVCMCDCEDLCVCICAHIAITIGLTPFVYGLVSCHGKHLRRRGWSVALRGKTCR